MTRRQEGFITQTSLEQTLSELVCRVIEPLGYELVNLEIQNYKQKKLAIYIDFSPSANRAPDQHIGIEDCVRVTEALNSPLDEDPEVESTFKGHYELEVSSPGLNRPLGSKKDFDRFKGEQVRIHLFRPMNSAEMENPEYCEKNPRQKNFLGLLQGIEGEKVNVHLDTQKVRIPLELISKANLEPQLDSEFFKDKERKQR